MARNRRQPAAQDLDLVPIMNLVTILIPFLLMASSFVTLAVVDSSIPGIQPDDQTKLPTDRKLVSVAITGSGYEVLGASDVLSPEEGGPTAVPCPEDRCTGPLDYDTTELVRLLGQVKDAHPDNADLVLVPDSRVSYEVLITTMDATREDPGVVIDGKARELFPEVSIAGGAE